MNTSTTIINSLFSISGKNVLITGGSRGIGLMIAKTFALAGANVLLTSRSELACKDATESIQKGLKKEQQQQMMMNSMGANSCSSSKVQYVVSNVSNRNGCEELAKYTAKVFNNKLDILINNAGASWGEPLERNSGKANWGFDKVLDLNIKGVFYLTRACIPLLENSSCPEDPSRIINIGSVVGIIPQAAPTYAYDASKAAVHSLTKKLAADLARKHITVNAVAPGFVETRMSSGLSKWGATPEVLKKSIPLGRMGNEDDMAGACIYLCSKAGSYLTGVILNVDGGSVGAIQIDLGTDSNL